MSDFSPTRLDRMRAALHLHVASGYTPGLVALLHHRGREHVEAVGTMAFDSTVPMTRDTIFRLASMTKPVTAVGAMILVEECRLRLDDPVDPWLPELRDRKVLKHIDGPLDDKWPRNARSRCATCSPSARGMEKSHSSRRRARSSRRWPKRSCR